MYPWYVMAPRHEAPLHWPFSSVWLKKKKKKKGKTANLDVMGALAAVSGP